MYKGGMKYIYASIFTDKPKILLTLQIVRKMY